LIAALCGYLFEPYALKKLEEGGPFIYRSLDKKSNEKDMNTMKLPEEMPLQIPPSTTRVIAETVTEGQTINQLHVPNRKNFPALDAWIPGIGGFQSAIGRTHTLNKDVGKYLAWLGKGANKLYWLLHRSNYSQFTCSKTVPGIEQYAVLIPVDDGIVLEP
jgi:hypothetical protein